MFADAVLVALQEPKDAYPDFSGAAAKKRDANRRYLLRSGVSFREKTAPLLATEDELLALLDGDEALRSADTLLLDISAFPKRFFCFLVKQLILRNSCRNVIVAYTEAAAYHHGHVAEDPMPCDFLPGFAAPLERSGGTLVISVGFESLGLGSLLRSYQERRGRVRLISSFPAARDAVHREWRTLFDMVAGDSQDVSVQKVEVIAPWDTELVYRAALRSDTAEPGIAMAPFGPKPHSLGMALYAIKEDVGVYYTQPRAYNPEYSSGAMRTWAYVVKWDGIACFERIERGGVTRA